MLETCCLRKMEHRKEEIKKEEDLLKVPHEEEDDESEEFGSDKWGQTTKKLWFLLEHPQTSLAARVFLYYLMFREQTLIGHEN